MFKPYKGSVMVKCKGSGCNEEVTRKGHYLCYSCWKKENKSPKKENVSSKQTDDMLNATAIGKEFGGISSVKMNLLLNELGWMYKPRHGKGWVATKQGKRQGAESRKNFQSGVPYVSWPIKILKSKILKRAVAEFKGETPDESNIKESPEYEDYRKKYEAKFRCQDGHYVRSQGEMHIDNWLYMNGIAHAYERKLPVEEDLISDFYIQKDGIRVFIEYWGMESNERYAERKRIKKEIYKKYDFNLIELNPDDIKNLDDIMPRKLLDNKISIY